LLFAIALIWLIAVGALSQPSVTPFPDVDPSAQMAGLMKHPLSIWQIAGQTLTSAEYFNVSRSVVGILGCLNVTLSPWVYAVGLDAILLAASTCFLQVSGRSPLYHITAALLFALSIGAIYGALYLTWTPAGAGAVSGFQGRYLLPYLVGLPLLIPALVPARWSIHRGRALARDIAVGAAGFAAWGMMIVIVADALFTLHDVYGSVFSGPWYSAASQ
jgi:uncharacterized membrane protein